MDDWVVSYRVDESRYVGSLLEGDWPEDLDFAFESLELPLCDMLEQC